MGLWTSNTIKNYHNRGGKNCRESNISTEP